VGKIVRFKDRSEAGSLLAQKLAKFKGKKCCGLRAFPWRSGNCRKKSQKYLNAPLDLIITRKISHPANPEYAVAAIAGNGHIMGKEKALISFDKDWLNEEIEKEKAEIIRRRKKYLGERGTVSPEGKIAILVDDGIATGLTMQVGIMELRHKNPKK
jgi:Predicted phosphoribosyltransferases